MIFKKAIKTIIFDECINKFFKNFIRNNFYSVIDSRAQNYLDKLNHLNMLLLDTLRKNNYAMDEDSNIIDSKMNNLEKQFHIEFPNLLIILNEHDEVNFYYKCIDIKDKPSDYSYVSVEYIGYSKTITRNT